MNKVRQTEKWTDESTDYECVALDSGWWCGYVRVPDDHPWFGIGYSDHLAMRCDNIENGKGHCYDHSPGALINVHGGITFSGQPHGVTEGHWFGFDCAHMGDFCDYGVPGLSDREGHHWTLDEIKAECAQFAKQLAEYGQGQGHD